MTCVLVLYVCLGTPAGYVSARIYKSESVVVVKGSLLLVTLVVQLEQLVWCVCVCVDR